jgi:hypothetical protein
MMTPDKRDGIRKVRAHDNDSRVIPFIVQKRGNAAHDNSHGHDSNDPSRAGKQLRKKVRSIFPDIGTKELCDRFCLAQKPKKCDDYGIGHE